MLAALRRPRASSRKLMGVLCADAGSAPSLARTIEYADSGLAHDVGLHPGPAWSPLPKPVEQDHNGESLCPNSEGKAYGRRRDRCGRRLEGRYSLSLRCSSRSRHQGRQEPARRTPDTGRLVVTSCTVIGGTRGSSTRPAQAEGPAKPIRAGEEGGRWDGGREPRPPSRRNTGQRCVPRIAAGRCGAWKAPQASCTRPPRRAGQVP